jgi:glycogen(starch) synthase
MRLLYMAQSFWPTIGGVEISHRLVLETLIDRGDAVTVLTSPYPGADSPEERLGAIEIRRFPFRQALEAVDPRSVAEGVAFVASVKRVFRPDVVHVALTDPVGFFHLRTLSAWPAATVVSVHVSITSLAGGPAGLFRRLLEQAKVVIANSNSTLAEIRAAAPSVADRLTRVRPASGVSFPHEQASRDGRLTRLLFVGRMAREKGADVLLSAMPAILARRPDVKLTLAGDGPDRAALEDLARTSGVMGACRFLGMVAHGAVGGLMAESDLVIVPSRWKEAFGLVAAEAAAAGRPVVASRVGGLTEIVIDGENGWLVEPGDTNALSSTVLRVLESPAEAMAMGRRGGARAAREFSAGALVTGYHAAYARALVSRPPE